jgi:tetraacyldisaccharide 4'-kinase
MVWRTPRFWYRPRPGLRARLLQPLGWFYGLAVRLHRRLVQPERLPRPVVSVGNLTLGGSGKTPLVIALAAELRRRGWRPAVLSRGYGSGRRQPLLVRPELPAAAVGDEPLELVRALPWLPVWVGSDRRCSGRRAIEAGADLLLLDDGLQHWPLARDCDLTLLDAERRLGNGFTFPAGPLREAAAALGRADLLVLTGAAAGASPAGLPWPAGAPWLALPATLVLPPELQGRPLLAFCGIGLPEKFFAALRRSGARLVAAEGFADHHPYAQSDLERLLVLARSKENATLVTTMKDWQRLRGRFAPALLAPVVPLPLQLDPGAVGALTDQLLARLQQRGWRAPGRSGPAAVRPDQGGIDG